MVDWLLRQDDFFLAICLTAGLFLASCSSDADDVAVHEAPEASDAESSDQDEWEPATSVPEPPEQGNDAADELFDIVTCLHDRGW